MAVQTDVLVLAELPTSMGTFEALLSDAGVRGLRFPNQRSGAPSHAHPLAGRLAEELDAYLRGRLRRFETPLDLRGTPFQLLVWGEVGRIEYGQVRRYGELAAAIGRPTAHRAVGAANGANRVPILVPCHRLISADGRLIKFGAGLEWKRRLLTLENPENWMGGGVGGVPGRVESARRGGRHGGGHGHEPGFDASHPTGADPFGVA